MPTAEHPDVRFGRLPKGGADGYRSVPVAARKAQVVPAYCPKAHDNATRGVMF